MNTLNSGFTRLSPEELSSKAGLIIGQLTNNPNFPTTDPTLATVQTARDDLNRAVAMPNGQARDAAIAAARSRLEQLLRDLAGNLERVPNVTEEMLATTGYDLRQNASYSSEPPPVPGNLRLKSTGTSGEVQFLFDASPRARSYQVQTASDPNSSTWADYDPFTSSRNVVVRGLPRAKDIWGRVRALGPRNTKSGWSDPATILVS